MPIVPVGLLKSGRVESTDTLGHRHLKLLISRSRDGAYGLYGPCLDLNKTVMALILVWARKAVKNNKNSNNKIIKNR